MYLLTDDDEGESGDASKDDNIVCRITGSVAAGLLGAGMFGFSRLTWTWSVTAEVFALNNLLVAILLVVAVYFNQCAAQEKAKVWSV